MFSVPERYRLRGGPLRSSEKAGNNGAFRLPPYARGEPHLTIIASDHAGWEHVSVSTPRRCPTWDEMNMIKDLFWGKDDLVVQYHPPKSDYVNTHKFCLHLWRKSDTNDFCARPPKVLVG